MRDFAVCLVAFLLPATLSVLNPSAAEETRATDQHPAFPPDTYAIQFLLRGAADRSPDHYLIALVETASEPTCEGAEGNRFCTCAVKIVDLLGAKIPVAQQQHPTEFRLITGSEDSNHGGSRVGSRFLVVAVPFPGKPGVYGSTAMINGPSSAEVEQARHELKGLVTK